jgi:hypothetical protein
VRRAQAYEALGRREEAVSDYRNAIDAKGCTKDGLAEAQRAVCRPAN